MASSDATATVKLRKRAEDKRNLYRCARSATAEETLRFSWVEDEEINDSRSYFAILRHCSWEGRGGWTETLKLNKDVSLSLTKSQLDLYFRNKKGTILNHSSFCSLVERNLDENVRSSIRKLRSMIQFFPIN